MHLRDFNPVLSGLVLTLSIGSQQPRKRGRPMKQRSSGSVLQSPVQSNMSHPGPQSALPPQTPQSQSSGLPSQMTAVTPSQSSPPPKTTPKSVIKALPTVRDHTTDQLGPEGDEYIPREYDDAGEKKVTATGHLNDNREYKCRTFFVPHRGDKLFMLATECARVLGYRDSYLLFNKNRSLYKIIATQAEKEDLIHQEILPFSYRSRQIAIVTAKSMFRQFGSRVIVNGRRVRDDYWETKARKQGFTEDDLAGEKRPGAAKAREAANIEAASNSHMINNQSDIIYSTAPVYSHPPPPSVHAGMMGAPTGLTPLPMITLAPEQTEIRLGLQDYRGVPRPRQEITGPAYQDRTQPSAQNDLMSQAQHAAEFNKSVNAQRGMRGQFMGEIWRKPHEPPPGSGGPLANPIEPMPAVTQSMQSPRTSGSSAQQMIPRGSSQNPSSGQSFSAAHQQNALTQSPMRSMAQTTISPEQMRNRSPSISLAPGGMAQNTGSYGFQQAQQSQMWPPPQPQQSPQHNYSYNTHGPQLSPQIQQSPLQQTPSLRHPSSNPQMQSMQYPGMQGMPQNYAGSGRGMFSNDPSQQYMPQNTSSGPGAQSWVAGQQPSASGNWGGPWQG